MTTIEGVNFVTATGAPVNGYGVVDLSGENFGEHLDLIDEVTFGPSGTEYVLYDSTDSNANLFGSCILKEAHVTLRCTMPSGVGKSHLIMISVGGQRTSTITAEKSPRLNFTAPNISAIFPARGVTTGDYLVTLSGSNFGSSINDIEVIFWNKVIDTSNVFFESSNQIFFVVPAGQGGSCACWSCAGQTIKRQ